MNTIKVEKMAGVPAEYRELLYEAMKTCSNPQRLLVAMFFLRDVSPLDMSNRLIEDTLRGIFPPSLPYGLTPAKYANFQASAVRQYFNFETQHVGRGLVEEKKRLWESPWRGSWRNTEYGNSYAVVLLLQRGVQVECAGKLLSSPATVLPSVRRPYLEEDLAAAALETAMHDQGLSSGRQGSRLEASETGLAPAAAKTQAEATVADEAQIAVTPRTDLLALSAEILRSLPAFDTPALTAEEADMAFSLGGLPEKVATALEALAPNAKTDCITLTITLGSAGYRVGVEAGGKSA